MRGHLDSNVGSLLFIKMKSFLSFVFILACVPSLFAQGGRPGECVRRVNIFRDAQYARPLPALKQVVAEKSHHARNTFHISPVCYFHNGASNAMVYWREGRALILWEPDPSATSNRRRRELVWSRRFLSLDEDVVPTLADVGGSNYLLTREMARRMVRDELANPNDAIQQIVGREPR
jgi:hypothetical protein